MVGTHDERSTRTRVLAEAARLFARRGFHGTSTRDIAEAAGIRQPSLYAHFPSKQLVAAALLDAELAPALDRVEHLAGLAAPSPVKLHALLAAELEAMDPDVRPLFGDAVVAEPELADQRRLLHRLFALVRGMVDAGVRAGDLAADPEVLTALVVSHLSGATSRHLVVAPNALALADLVVRGALARPELLPEVRAAAGRLRPDRVPEALPAVLPPGDTHPRVGARLRAEREARRRTVAEVAEAAGLTKGFLSRIERDLANASVAALVRLCAVLDLPIGSLFDDPPPGEVVRGGAYPSIAFGGDGLREYALTPRGERRFQAILSEIAPGGTSGNEPHVLPGDVEFVLVLAGTVVLEFPTSGADSTMTLSTGDAFTFDPGTPHVFRSGTTAAAARVLWVLSPALPDGGGRARASEVLPSSN
ncbi:TetR family transcriptional regulator [Umezawaea sp. NPDC059074]|uniref:TetR family transcriptional regulator n=1 Tax=Umezawaea sp. NPDC059074 TaxID=3346716 RepID=UPI0036AB861E